MSDRAGWGPGSHVVPLEGRRDRLEIQSSKIHISLNFPSLKKGIVPFLNQFGSLRFGNLKPSVFKERYRNLLVNLISDLKQINSLSWEGDWDELKIQNMDHYQRLKCAAFWLQMMRISQRESWKYPALLRWENQELRWENGNSRIVATGMTKPQPWNHLKFLYWHPKGDQYDPLDDQAVDIENDQDLHRVLDLKFDDTQYHQPNETSLGIFIDQGKIEIKWINDGIWTGKDYNEETQKIWYDHVAWRNLYGQQPRLFIYTNWPDKIKDSNNCWRWEILGPSQEIIDNLLPGRPGSIHWLLQNHIHGNCRFDHVLWVTKDTEIDIGDLICWMDDQNTAYVDSEYKFALYRRADRYRSTVIDITR